ncbi:MAG: antitoxin family protein [Desulfobacterales bacterium]|nr:antitoxin family protein [Desulfobacterales bacterium]
MSQLITAIFENGVFRPMQNVDVKEHEKVTIKVVSMHDWQKRIDRIMNKIHEKTALYSSEEMEFDIIQAVNEVREEKNGR